MHFGSLDSGREISPLEPGGDLREKLRPLTSHRGFEIGEASDVSTRAVEPRDDTAGDGIGHSRKDDRDRPRLPLEGNGGLRGARLFRAAANMIGTRCTPMNASKMMTRPPPGSRPRA